MRAAIYTRVSTTEQAEEGFSLAAQLEKLNAYCTSQGWAVADVYTDEGISAKNMDRPQLQRMLSEMPHNKFDVILVVKLDRLTRSVLDLYEMLQMFDKHRIGFKSATEVFDTTTAMGRLFITMVAALAQWERETIGERTREGQGQMVREGRYFGHTAPYGYELRDGNLFVHAAESTVIQTVFNLYLNGSGASRIVKYLNDPANQVLSPRNSNQWSQKVVLDIIKNPVYAGYVRYGNKTRKKHNGEMVIARSTHEPIISDGEFERAQELINQRRSMSPRSGTGIHPLVGILRCGICGGAMIAHTARAGHSGRVTDYHGYMCNERRHKRTCTMKMWKSDKLENTVVNQVEKLHKLISKKVQMKLPKNDETEQKIRYLESELESVKSRRAKTVQAYTKNYITDEDLQTAMESISQDESRLKTELASLNPSEYIVMIDQLRNFKETWNVATPQERRQLIRDVAQTIWVMPDGNVRVELRLSN